MQNFDFFVNGRPVSVSLENEETPLLNVLRNELGLVGTRFGCGLEQCGCCIVLIDGKPEKCCAKPVWSVAGKLVRFPRRAGRPVRLLSVRYLDLGKGTARQEPFTDSR